MKEDEKRKSIGFELGKDWEEKVWRNFLKSIESSGRNHKTSEFLDSILCLNEKKLIAKRLATFSLIKSGKSYKEIGRILWISPSTISALKKSIIESANYKSSRHRDLKKKIEKQKRSRGVPQSTILDYWASLPLPSKSGYQRHNRK